MTAHQLAKRLLDGPDWTVMYSDAEWGPTEIEEIIHTTDTGIGMGEEVKPIILLEQHYEN